MKILFKIILGVVILAGILLIVALFVKKDYSVEREITINKPKSQVFDYIKYLKNQDNYSVWSRMDPKMKKEYRGTDGTAGFVSAWESDNNKVGKGEQQIDKISEGDRIDLDLHFIEPFEGRADARMVTESVSDNQTKVKWGFDSRMKYPMNIMLLFMNMDKMIGNDLQTGLDTLKSILEKQ
ncbi:SRPBCC family protein [Terrimonas pollutisoli]|uniref:SRPBCC family protein n=1 Tax=Terrimonas pollutisoli TaxID=3034147 RepID=UPI0023EBA213|nr:SRPBCC family protein [Terrimonas sp. H1YJ31]